MNTATVNQAFQGLKALVVDDSESARDILQRILESEGFTVDTANDGSAAIDLVRADPAAYELILIDLVMEQIDGVETIRQLTPILGHRGVPMIPMSATLTPAIEAKCREAGAFPATLRKPFRISQVERVLSDALGERIEHDSRTSVKSVQTKLEIEHAQLAVPGCDIPGAIERCGGDLALLKRLVFEFRDVGNHELQVASSALRAHDVKTADRAFHKLRGEFLNLGFVELVGELMALQAQIAPTLAQSQELRQAVFGASNIFEPLIGKISLLRDRMLLTLERVTRLSIFSEKDAIVPEPQNLQTPGAEGQTGNFQRLVGMLLNDDPTSLSLINQSREILPTEYNSATKERFFDHVEALEFEQALNLLKPEDIDSAIFAPEEDGFRILIVDDAAVTVRLLSRLLEGMAAQRIALNADRALAIARIWHPDLIISDVDMGETSGIELCRTVKFDPELSSSTVMLISASEDVAVEVEGLTAGAVDFLEKPLNPARVVGRVAAQLSAIRRKAESASLFGELDLESKTGFLTSDLSGQILDISPPLARWLEQPSRPQPGLLLHDLFDPSAFATIYSSVRNHQRGGRIGPLETVMISVSGARLPVRVIGRDMPGQKSRILWFGIEDISARVAQEHDRSEAEVSRKIGVLSSGIAHEFNNLLGVVIGRIDLALELTRDPKITNHLNQANEAALRAANISRSLRNAADQAGTKKVKAQKLSEVLDQCWPMLRNLVPPSISLERDVEDDSLEILIDSKELRGILMQLVENAAQACSKGASIRIHAYRQAAENPGSPGQFDRAVIEVIDTGSGMVEDTRNHAFDAFFTTKGPQHTGLGLTQVRNTASKAGARTSIQSLVGQGTTVRLEFPIAATARSQ